MQIRQNACAIELFATKTHLKYASGILILAARLRPPVEACAMFPRQAW
jgi:hypothetical protein